MELTLDQALMKGVEAHKAGQVTEAIQYYKIILKAQPKHPNANHNMGTLAASTGKFQEALPFFKTALESNPSIDQFWLSYIGTLIKLNRVADAKVVFDQAKSKGAEGDGFDRIEKKLDLLDLKNSNVQDPSQEQLNSLMQLYNQKKFEQVFKECQKLTKQYTNSLTLWNLVGASAAQIGNLDEAVHAFQKTISIKPDYAEAYSNMGIALNNQGKLKESIEAYQKALSLKPDYAEAYNNMGITLKDQGKLEEAIEAYKKVVSLRPDYAEAYNNIGNALKYQGKLEDAIGSYTKAISLKPDYAEAYNNIGNVLTGFNFKKPNRGLQNIISSLLEKKFYVRPKDIAVAAISLLKLEPILQKKFKLVSSDKVIQNPLDIISDFNELPLLLKLMSVCPIPDLEIEKLLKNLRASILENISFLKVSSPELLRFQSALALQCFTNEYLYYQNHFESKALKKLEILVKEDLDNGKQPRPQFILCLASYKSLNKYEWCNSLTLNKDIEDVFIRQVIEPMQETDTMSHIPILGKITDSVSSLVRKQYESSPYPRWINLGIPEKSISISQLVHQSKLRLFNYNILNVTHPNILIAGCGTGQHSITTAVRFKSSKVLAIDLSLSSLAYAKRKTDELAIENIDYMQADILNLGQFNKQFDIIESAGVLHHMDNPMKGWKVLTDHLKPGGLMRIGLYSELARQNIVKIRKEISQTGIGSSDAEMRSFRDIIIKSDKDHHKLTIESTDFYSLSTLKDLLFHVQEHRFTIPLIKDHLNKLGLKFCGFESSKIVQHFKLTNKYKEDIYDLEKWQAYEEANPRAFAGMYQFWCQKGD